MKPFMYFCGIKMVRFSLISVLVFATMLQSGCRSLARKTVLPGSFLQSPNNVVKQSPQFELVELALQDGTKIMAQFGRALNDADPMWKDDLLKRPTVLFFYGNRMCIAASQGIFEDLRRMGVNVLIPDYPGYGMSGGTASESYCYAAATAAYGYLSNRAEVDFKKIFVVGMSLGGGVAVDLAARKPVAGLALVVPFASVRAVGKDGLAWYLRWGVPMIARYAAFDNVAKIPRVACPILLVQAKNDQITTSKRSDEIVAAAKAKIDRVIVDSDHDGSWAKGRAVLKEWLDERIGN